MSRVVSAAVLLLLGLGGCQPGSLNPSLFDGGGGGSTCDPTPIFADRTCSAQGACHDAMGSAANFNMATPGFEKNLVGVNPKGGGTIPSQCATNGPYLVPNVQPATGLFLLKLKGGAGLCGVQMPQIGNKLTATELTCVQKWANTLVANGGSGTDAGGTGGTGGSDGGASGQ